MSALSEMLTAANKDGLSYEVIRDKARERGLSVGHDTVWKYMTGRHGRVSEPQLRAICVVLGVDFVKARLAAKLPADLGEYTPPPEARALTRAERDALDLLIRSMATARGAAQASRGGLASVRTFPDPDVYDEAAADETKEPAGADTTDKQ